MTQSLPANKKAVSELGIFGGKPVFEKIRSTSNLVTPSKEKFLNYCKTIFETGVTSNGKLVKQMEEKFAELHDAKHCVAVCNGLWALVMCLKLLGIKGRNEVIMPSLTYRRMADVAAWAKLTPHFCDVDEKNLGIAPQFVEPLINENTAVIIAAHPMVHLADIDGMVKLAAKHKIPLMFDSVEAAYAEHNGRKLGGFSEAEVFSMHASKFLNSYEGGYVTTDNKDLADALCIMRNNGFDDNGDKKSFGLNARMSELHAAMALAGIDDLPEQVERNKVRFIAYDSALKNVKGISLVQYDTSKVRSFKTILIKIDEEFGLTREELINVMHKENMLVRAYYSPPLHLKKAEYKTIAGKLPNTEKLMTSHMIMPCGDFVSLEDVKAIGEFMDFVQRNAADIKQKLKAAA